MQANALATARGYEKQAIERLRRMGIAAADLEVKGQRKIPGQSGLGQAMSASRDDASAA